MTTHRNDNSRGAAGAPGTDRARPGVNTLGRAPVASQGRTAAHEFGAVDLGRLCGEAEGERLLGRIVDYIVLEPADWQAVVLSANDRLHYRERAERVRYWRQYARLAARLLRPVERARLMVYYRFPDNGRRDVGNLQPTSKAIVDGMIDAGLLPDDSDAYLIGPDNRRDLVKGPHRVVVLVMSL